MAKTSKGIYYPYNYNEIADIPEDMKQMAESINKLLEDKEVDETTQNAKITDLQNKVNDLQQENTELSNNMPWNTTSGKSLHITDSAKYSKNRLEVSGDMEQENLLNIEDATITSKGITSIAKSGVLNINGTTIADWFDITSGSNKIKVDLKSNIEYALDINKALPSGIVLVARFYNEDNENVVQSVRLENGSTRVTFTLSKNIERCYFTTTNCAIGQVVSVNDLKIKMFAVEIKTTTGVQKIRQFGKNCFSKDSANTLNAYTDSTIVANVNSKTLFVKCKPLTTYTISRTKIGKRFQVGECSELPKAGSSLNNLIPNDFVNELKSITITTSLSAKYLVVFYSNSTNDNINNNGYTEEELRNSIQIEEGSTATTYEHYWEQIHTLNLGTTQLCAIKDINGNIIAKDRSVFRNGKWQWEKKIGKRVLNGTEEWQAVESSSATTSSSKGVFYLLGRENIQITSHFKNNNLDSITNNLTAFNNLEDNSFNVRRNTQDRVYFRKSDITELNEFKTWLSTHNLTVYYILENPQYIDCTTEQSVVLDKLYNNFELGKGTNNIIVESENGVGVDMDLTYMQDLQAKLNSLEAMCVSNASQEV